MDVRQRCLVALLGVAGLGVVAQVPFERMTPENRAAVEAIVRAPDFRFETFTKPSRVRLETMDKLFDRPRLAAAMWRYCQFVPTLFAVEHPNKDITVDDSRGLKGTLVEVSREPGRRVFLIHGRVERGRMGNPMAVSAAMVVIYKYWETSKGFHSHLQTWTVLDSALLAFLSRPFKNYIQRRQQEFIDYINHNIAQGGAFAQINPTEFAEPLRKEGDSVAIRQYVEVFGRKGH